MNKPVHPIQNDRKTIQVNHQMNNSMLDDATSKDANNNTHSSIHNNTDKVNDKTNNTIISDITNMNTNYNSIDSNVELDGVLRDDKELNNTEVSDSTLDDADEHTEVDEYAEFDHAAIEHVLTSYFTTLNKENFQATAQLFEPDGVLNPPFEQGIVGREAIVTYLEKEAKNLQLIPLKTAIKPSETGEIKCKVGGKVNTPLFSVNVAWKFILSSTYEIRSVEVKLLAALEDLLKMRNSD